MAPFNFLSPYQQSEIFHEHKLRTIPSLFENIPEEHKQHPDLELYFVGWEPKDMTIISNYRASYKRYIKQYALKITEYAGKFSTYST